jgi:hypothetical protein
MSGLGDDVFVFVLEIGAVPQHGFIIFCHTQIL